MDTETKRKVWVEVDVELRHGDLTPRLTNSIDPARAREALLNLLKFRPGYGPAELFDTNNPFYIPRRSVVEVARSHGIDPEKFLSDAVDNANRVRDNHPRYTTDSKQAKAWAETTGHTPEEYLSYSKDLAAKSIRQQYTTPGYWITSPYEELPDSVDEGYHSRIHDAAKAIGITPKELMLEMQGDDDAPFFSEAYLYTLVGKDTARSVLGRLNELKYALGMQ